MPKEFEKWYGEESAYQDTDELLIDDSIPVFDRGGSDGIGNPQFGIYYDAEEN